MCTVHVKVKSVLDFPLQIEQTKNKQNYTLPNWNEAFFSTSNHVHTELTVLFRQLFNRSLSQSFEMRSILLWLATRFCTKNAIIVINGERDEAPYLLTAFTKLLNRIQHSFDVLRQKFFCCCCKKPDFNIRARECMFQFQNLTTI